MLKVHSCRYENLVIHSSLCKKIVPHRLRIITPLKLCQGLQECKFIENGLRHRCFSVNFVKSFRKAFFAEQMRTAVSIILKNEKDKFFGEAVVNRCSVKNVFLEIPQNSRENTCARVFF